MLYTASQTTKATMDTINFTKNPKLLDNNTDWYPTPYVRNANSILATPSFDREIPYICCIGKTHLVFRMLFAEGYSGMRTERSRDRIGVDLILQHNASVTEIDDCVVKIIAQAIKVEVIKDIIVSYCDLSFIYAEILYPLVIQEAHYRRRQASELFQNSADNRIEIPTNNSTTAELAADAISSINRNFINEKTSLLDQEDARAYLGFLFAAPGRFTTTPVQTRYILNNKSFDIVSTKTSNEFRSLRALQLHARDTNQPYDPSNYIRLDFPVPPPHPQFQAIAHFEQNEIQHLEIPDYSRSCLQMMAEFLEALWEMITTFFSDCYRGTQQWCWRNC